MQNQSVTQIRILVKKLLKKQGLGYADLAKELNLSLAAVKKLMSQGDFTVSRLERLAKLFEFTLFEFMTIANKSAIEPYEFSQMQEEVFVKNPRALHFLLLLGAGFSLNEVSKRLRLTVSQVNSFLFLLDKVNAIELKLGTKHRLLARGPFKMRPTGILRSKYFHRFTKHLISLVEQKPAKEALQIPFELYLSRQLFQSFKADLTALYERYRSLSRIDHEINASADIEPISGLFLLKPYDSWGAVLNDRGVPN